MTLTGWDTAEVAQLLLVTSNLSPILVTNAAVLLAKPLTNRNLASYNCISLCLHCMKIKSLSLQNPYILYPCSDCIKMVVVG